MNEIWRDSIVEENNITVSMSILRKALGEDRVSPRFIETVPRKGYRFIADVTEVLPQRTAMLDAGQTLDQSATHHEPIDSLAVLPLQSNGNDQDVEYLSDGITESIINTLSRIPQLRVMARSSVSSYKGREVDPKQVGRELNVETVLTREKKAGFVKAVAAR